MVGPRNECPTTVKRYSLFLDTVLGLGLGLAALNSSFQLASLEATFSTLPPPTNTSSPAAFSLFNSVEVVVVP